MEVIGNGLQALLQEKGNLPSYKPRFPWRGGDLQTLRNIFVPPPFNGSFLPKTKRLLVELDDNAGKINVAVDYPVCPSNSVGVLLIHGLSGDENSSYMHLTTSVLLEHGYTVYRFNYRGIGPSRKTSKAPYSGGLTGDARAAIRTITQYHEKIHIMGFSLGGQMLIRMLGEGDVPAGVGASVSVSAPIDMSICCHQVERTRNKPYLRYLVNGMRADMKGLTHPAMIDDPQSYRSVREFDEKLIAPVFGYRDSEDYYAKVSAKYLVHQIKHPLLALHAANDPWIPADCYRKALWPKDILAGAVIVGDAGHLGFHGIEHKMPWYIYAAIDFFNKV